MIGRLSGILLDKQAPYLLLDVSGIGYEITTPMSTFFTLPAINEYVSLFTHLIVREDIQLLYGFATVGERSLFRSLLKVNGVGAKLALAILSGIDVVDFVRSVQEADAASLTRLPGVGKKTAERLVVEMRDRLQDMSDNIGTVSSDKTKLQGAKVEAVSVLAALGYKRTVAEKMIRTIDNDSLSTEQLVKFALQRS